MATYVFLAHIRWTLILIAWVMGTNAQIDILYSLGSLLSPDANIYFPNSTAYSDLTATLNAKKPAFDAVVEVYTAKDVENTVCNPF